MYCSFASTTYRNEMKLKNWLNAFVPANDRLQHNLKKVRMQQTPRKKAKKQQHY